MTLTQVMKIDNIKAINSFVEDLWQQAESWGRLKDTNMRHTTWYKRHRFEVDLVDGKAKWLTVHQGGHTVIYAITGGYYSDIQYVFHW